MSAIKTGAIVVVVSTLLAAACSSTGDEPSPTPPPTSDPVVIRLGTGDPRGFPDTPVVERFADAVEKLSDGGMRVEFVWNAAGNVSVPDGFEQGVVQLVQDGELDLGWIAARAWDTVGVTSFQALQAPFLITDHGLLTEVLASPMADEMIASLGDVGLVGLGLYPDGLRYPLGYAAPMASLEDFDGADIRLVPSEATEALVRALGGRPVYGLAGDALDAAIASGDVDGTEVSLGLAPIIAQDVAPRSVVTGNVVLFPRVNTLFAGQDLMASLSDEQEAILAAAAEETHAFATSAATEDFRAFCEAGGQVAIASEADVAALERAASPVYRLLEADPQTKALIDEIASLKEGRTVTAVPAYCSAG
jgi:TRAP-type C4-dicarboxylate transport system substrate-binding protein